MNRFAYSSLAAAGLIGLGSFAAPAFASLYVDNVSTNPGLGANPRSDVALTYNVDGMSATNEAEYAVQILLTVNQGSSANTSAEYTLPVWCVDIFHDIVVGSSGEVYTPGPLNTDNSGSDGAGTALTNNQIAEIGDLVNYGNYLMSQNKGNIAALDAAEVQSAIWTVEYNNGTNTLSVVSDGIGGPYFGQTDINNTIAAASTYGGSAGQLLDGVQAEAFVTPAPSIGSGLPSVLAIGGVLFGANLFGRSKKRLSVGIAIPHAAG